MNGVDTGVVGLGNKTSMIGQSLPLGHANAGDALTFVLNNKMPDGTINKAYSDPTLNVSYDINGSLGHQHVYSTSYTATSPILDSIPVGTFVSWADHPNGDFSYNNLDFVLTNVSGKRSRPHHWCGTARPDLGRWRPSLLVATAAEDRLSFRRRNPHTSFAAASARFMSTRPSVMGPVMSSLLPE